MVKNIGSLFLCSSVALALGCGGESPFDNPYQSSVNEEDDSYTNDSYYDDTTDDSYDDTTSTGGSSFYDGTGGSTSDETSTGGSSVTTSCPEYESDTYVVTARDPEDGIGEITRTNVCVPEYGNIDSITLKYSMDSFIGEPTRQAVFKYEAEFSISQATWIAQVVDDTYGEPIIVNGREVYVSWSEGTWPEPYEGYGSDVTGSPSWDDVFGHYSSGLTLDTMLTETEAKNIYTDGFSLANLQMLEVNGVELH